MFFSTRLSIKTASLPKSVLFVVALQNFANDLNDEKMEIRPYFVSSSAVAILWDLLIFNQLKVWKQIFN